MYKCNIKVWSATGHTPITGRKGYFCDVLIDKVIDVKDHNEAIKAIRELIVSTDYASTGHYYIPEYWNHNLKSNFVN